MGYEANASATRGHAFDSTRVSGSERDLRYGVKDEDRAQNSRELVGQSADDARLYERPERRRERENEIIKERNSVLEASIQPIRSRIETERRKGYFAAIL